MPHITLLGDSIFDNAVYADPEPDVAAHLRDVTGPDTKVTLLAVDGSITRDVAAQIDRIPGDTSHLVVSSGGNDALGVQNVLSSAARDVARALSMLYHPLEAFCLDYDAIYRTANRIRADVIELRSICTESADYANPIEPSGPGGLKIAKAIAAWLRSSGAESTGDATT